MTTTAPQSRSPEAAERRDALADRLFEATVGALELFSVHLGWRLGLYRTLAKSGPSTAAELARAAGIDERYGREWLEQQAVAGLLDVDDASAAADQRRYSLPEGHDDVLVAAEDPAHVAPFGGLVAGIGGTLPALLEAYRSGAGVPYPSYGADFRDGQGAINRPTFTHDLPEWFRAIPEIHTRLQAEPPAKVADLGCGQGWSTLAIAAAYPTARTYGYDADDASIGSARQNADGHDAGSRVTFEVRDAEHLTEAGPFDLVCVFEALHDLSRPVEVLAAARSALAPGGFVLVVDERVSDQFVAPGDMVERIMYGWSVNHCLPASRASEPSAALGTVLRAGTVRELGAQAGFAAVDVLPIENLFFRLYLLRP